MPYAHNPTFPYGFIPPRPWTSYEDFVLGHLAAIGVLTPGIARQLGRSVAAVYARAAFLGISLIPPDPPQ